MFPLLPLSTEVSCSECSRSFLPGEVVRATIHLTQYFVDGKYHHLRVKIPLLINILPWNRARRLTRCRTKLRHAEHEQLVYPSISISRTARMPDCRARRIRLVKVTYKLPVTYRYYCDYIFHSAGCVAPHVSACWPSASPRSSYRVFVWFGDCID